MSSFRESLLAPQPAEVAKYTSSVGHDVEIAEEVVKINKAHVVMLAEKGLISRRVAALILKALDSAVPSKLTDPSLEDVHMNLERYVEEAAGYEAAGWMHLAKSRNDQVAAAIRMRLRLKIIEAGLALIKLRRALLKQCAKHTLTVMPGYTHLQRAQPVTLALHLLAHHEALARDTDRLRECYARVNLSPMGAAALAGSSLPIDRRMVAELLGFDGLVENTIDAVSSRDFALEAMAAASIAMHSLSRLAGEIVLWATPEFGFLELADEYVSTSSIMPQKRNPVVAEVARARAYRTVGDLASSIAILSSLPLSYNLDLQEVTPLLWDCFEHLISTLKVMEGLIATAEFKEERMEALLRDGYSNATELANLLALKGVSFRRSHQVVATLVKKLLKEGRGLSEATLEDLTSAALIHGVKVEVSAEELQRALDPRWAIEACKVEGGPSPKVVEEMIEVRLKKAEEDEALFTLLKSRLEAANDRLQSLVRLMASEVG
ncbi:MAG: argininosuccinate lyase [Candidatus Nezhaarchaeota archaeon]|nr:argininosuccinate lyase [Candidatus Nezhaarchaeota archaeon]